MKSNKFAFTGLLCLLALLLNIASAMLASALKLPTFLDTIFTVAITFYAGLIPGIIVATLFNPVMTLLRCAMTGSEIFLYDFLYGICGILIVIASWLFSRNKKEFPLPSDNRIFFNLCKFILCKRTGHLYPPAI